MAFYFARKRPTGHRDALFVGGGTVTPHNKSMLARLGCQACPLDKVDICTPKMQPTLSKGAAIYILAEAPGKDEDEHTGKPLTGPSGRLIRECIPDGEKCSFDNIINCRPTNNRNPTPHEIESCRPRRVKFIEEAKPKLILGLGVIPLQAIMGTSDMAGMRGRCFAIKVGSHCCWFLPTYHPSFILRIARDRGKPLNSMLGHCFRMDVKKAFELAHSLKPPIIDSEADVRSNIQCFDGTKDTAFDQLMELLRKAKAAPVKAIDLETKGLRPWAADAAIMTAAVSFGDTNFSFAIDHPKAGWRKQTLGMILRLFGDLIKDDTIKVAHNAPFEITWLIKEFGPEVVNHASWQCSQMQAHFLDERKGQRFSDDSHASKYQALDFLVKQYFGISFKPLFKLDKKDMSKADLGEMLIYNCLMKGTSVITEKGNIKIEELVRKKLRTKVLSMDEKTGELKWAAISDWHKTRCQNQIWLEIKTEGSKSVIRCTPDHEILTPLGRKQANAINTRDLIYSEELAWSAEFFQAIIGTLLGDSTITKTRNLAYIKCSNRNKELLELKHTLFGGQTVTRKSIGGYKDGIDYCWWLPSDSQTEAIRKATYFNGKRVAKPLLPFLSSQGLALWYMDDGFQQKGRSPHCCFAVQRYEDKDEITQWFTKRFGGGRVDSNGTLRLTVEASKKLCMEIAPYVVQSMRYKMPYFADSKAADQVRLPATNRFYFRCVESVKEVDLSKFKNRGYADVRYCITVPETGNFMTLGGLVSNCADTKYGLRLYNLQNRLLDDRGLLDAYLDSVPRQPTVALIQHIGVPVNQNVCKIGQKTLELEVKELETKINSTSVVQQFIKDCKHFNWASQPDVLILFKDYLNCPEVKITDKSGNERLSVDKNILDKIDHPLAKLITQVRNRAKLKSTYVDEFELGKGRLIFPDGKLHANLNTTFTETGRTSCDEPNLQNFSKRGADVWVRSQIVPPPGHLLVAVDYGQLEACTGAMCSKDKYLVKALWEDYDTHSEWARKTALKEPALIGGKANLENKDVMKKFRSLIKNKLTFPAFFGASNQSVRGYLHNATGINIEQYIVDDLMDEFWNTFAGMATWQKRTMKRYYDIGYVETLCGRRHHYPLTKNQAVNMPIQGTAAELVCDAMNRLSYIAATTGKWYLHPVMNIHDDLSFFIPDNDQILEDSLNIISHEMLTFDYDWINVPLSIEVSIGKNWADVQPIAGKIWSHRKFGFPQREP